jgi:CheY-like chemotaxis protein
MKTILIVDDEAFARRMVGYKLKQRGYDVLTADSGEAAIEQLHQTPVDLIVTDNQMPGMTGIELAQHLSRDSRYANVPVMMISAREFEIGQGELRETSIRAVVAKPFSMHSVVRQVEQLIGPGDSNAPAVQADCEMDDLTRTMFQAVIDQRK